MRLTEKVAVITGSGRGIGRAIAARLAKDGALIVVHCGSNLDAAAETVREIESKGGAAFAVKADLSAIDQIQRFSETLDAGNVTNAWKLSGTGWDETSFR